MDTSVSTDLVEIAERGVLAAAKAWHAIWREEATWDGHKSDAKRLERLHDAECEVLAAVTLLESREVIKATTGYDPDHWNPAKGGNRASDDYW